MDDGLLGTDGINSFRDCTGGDWMDVGYLDTGCMLRICKGELRN